jgi:hypothetical protein
MNFLITKNNTQVARSALYSTIEFNTVNFSNRIGLETRTETVAIQRFTTTQPSLRETNSSITINAVQPIQRIIY